EKSMPGFSPLVRFRKTVMWRRAQVAGHRKSQPRTLLLMTQLMLRNRVSPTREFAVDDFSLHPDPSVRSNVLAVLRVDRGLHGTSRRPHGRPRTAYESRSERSPYLPVAGQRLRRGDPSLAALSGPCRTPAAGAP